MNSAFLPLIVLCFSWRALSADLPRLESTGHFEVRGGSANPGATSLADEQERIINELYGQYVDCLDGTGSEEICYLRWRRECKALLSKGCSALEEKMFPSPAAGDESC